MKPLPSSTVSRLSPEDRLGLIGQLWDSLDDSDTPVTAAQMAELDYRLANADARNPDAVTWDQLRDELDKYHA